MGSPKIPLLPQKYLTFLSQNIFHPFLLGFWSIHSNRVKTYVSRETINFHENGVNQWKQIFWLLVVG